MLSNSRASLRVISRVEVSLCHLADDALGSTGCGVGRCSRYLLESRLVLRVGQIYGLVKLSKKNALGGVEQAGSASLSPRHAGHANKFPVVADSPWTAHVDRLGFHGELHSFPRFLGQSHQHRQPLAGRRARRFEAHLNNNSSAFRTASSEVKLFFGAPPDSGGE